MARKHEIRETPHDTKWRLYRLTVQYLGLGYSVETVAKIVSTSVEYVQWVENFAYHKDIPSALRQIGSYCQDMLRRRFGHQLLAEKSIRANTHLSDSNPTNSLK